MDKLYTIDEIREIQDEQKYKFIGLNTSGGKEVIKQNNAAVTPEKKLDMIETRLKAPKFKDGYYVVYCRSHHSSEPDNYTIIKGDPATVSEAPTPAPAPEVSKAPSVLTYDKAIAMNKEIAELKAEVERLKGELDRKTTDYDELLDEAQTLEQEREDTLAETNVAPNSTATMVKEVATLLVPIMDRHYDMQEQKMLIERGKLMRDLQADQDKASTNGQPAPAPPVQEVEFVELDQEQVDGMGDEAYQRYRNALLVHLAHTDPERYEKMMVEIKGEVADGE